MTTLAEEAYLARVLPGSPGGPLLLTLHGTGGDENQLAGRQLLPAATVVSPRGDVSEHGAARFFRRTGEGVYDMADLARATAKMARFVKAERDRTSASAVLGLGYSNGANVLASVLFAEPGLFDAVALMHPLIPFDPAISGGLAGKDILITAGRRDPICPPDQTGRLEAGLRSAGANVSVVWHDGGHELRPTEVEAARSHFRPFNQRGA
jgi:phospholipase/carboxylesterase